MIAWAKRLIGRLFPQPQITAEIDVRPALWLSAGAERQKVADVAHAIVDGTGRDRSLAIELDAFDRYFISRVQMDSDSGGCVSTLDAVLRWMQKRAAHRELSVICDRQILLFSERWDLRSIWSDCGMIRMNFEIDGESSIWFDLWSVNGFDIR